MGFVLYCKAVSSSTKPSVQEASASSLRFYSTRTSSQQLQLLHVLLLQRRQQQRRFCPAPVLTVQVPPGVGQRGPSPSCTSHRSPPVETQKTIKPTLRDGRESVASLACPSLHFKHFILTIPTQRSSTRTHQPNLSMHTCMNARRAIIARSVSSRPASSEWTCGTYRNTNVQVLTRGGKHTHAHTDTHPLRHPLPRSK